MQIIDKIVSRVGHENKVKKWVHKCPITLAIRISHSLSSDYSSLLRHDKLRPRVDKEDRVWFD